MPQNYSQQQRFKEEVKKFIETNEKETQNTKTYRIQQKLLRRKFIKTSSYIKHEKIANKPSNNAFQGTINVRTIQSPS